MSYNSLHADDEDKINLRLMEISAKEGINLDSVFEDIAHSLYEIKKF